MDVKDNEILSTLSNGRQDFPTSQATKNHTQNEFNQQTCALATPKEETESSENKSNLMNNIHESKHLDQDVVDGIHRENDINRENPLLHTYNDFHPSQSNPLSKLDVNQDQKKNTQVLASYSDTDVLSHKPHESYTNELNDNELHNDVPPMNYGYNADHSTSTQVPQFYNPGQFQQNMYTQENYETGFSSTNTEKNEISGKKLTFLHDK